MYKLNKDFFSLEIKKLFHEEISSFFIDENNIPELFKIDYNLVNKKINSSYINIYASKEFDIDSLSNIKINEKRRNDKEPTNIYIYTKTAGKINLINQKPHNIFMASSNINISLEIFRSSNIIVGEATTITGCRISGGCASLAIMKGNLCSDNVKIQISDQHSIFSTTDGCYRNDFNVFKYYKIGIHSWCCRGVTLIKPLIEDNTIIGAGAVLVGKSNPFSIYAGNPARCIKENRSFISGNMPLNIEKKIIKDSFNRYDYNGKVPL